MGSGSDTRFLCEILKQSQNFHYGFSSKPRSNGCDQLHMYVLGSAPAPMSGCHLPMDGVSWFLVGKGKKR